MKVISWQPVLTDHQSYTLEAFQQASDCTLTIYVLKAENKARILQGWVNRHADSLSPQIIPQKGWFFYVVKQLWDNRNAVHVFASPFEKLPLIITLLIAVAMGSRVFLISEPYSPISTGYQNNNRRFINGVKAILRPALYYVYGALLGRRISGVFAISSLAVFQYRRMGINKEKIFPFGYFVPRSSMDCMDRQVKESKNGYLRLIFIGTLIERKGLDVLIKSITSLNANGIDITIDVFGSGEVDQFEFNQSTINYCGLIPFGTAQDVIAGYDVLVLPSRNDGWGVVVNEALMAGVPVICSNRVGAGAIIDKWQCGDVFISEDSLDLERVLNKLIISSDTLENMRIAAHNVNTILAPEVAGRYMYDIISDESIGVTKKAPSCPWYEV